ncbi:MAG: hypothetical protein RhofKO_10170 [Rhodothermales bacterium]
MRARLLSVLSFLLILPFLPQSHLKAQQGELAFIHGDTHAFLVRRQLAGGLDQAFLSNQPLSRLQVAAYLDSLGTSYRAMSSTDQARFARLYAPRDAAAFQSVGPFYTNGQDFLHTRSADYTLALNPLLGIGLMTSRQSERDDVAGSTNEPFYHRGARLSGTLRGRWYFDATVMENVVTPPPYLLDETRQRINGTKRADQGRQLDYLTASSVIGYRGPYIEARIGRSTQHWGPGRTSLLLSNHGAPHDFVQVRATLGPVQYTTHYASFVDLVQPKIEGVPGSQPFRYGVFHRLTFRPSGRLEIAAFEGLILAPNAEERSLGFFATYLNPLIFLRAVDFDAGSPGNALVGIDVQWIPMAGVALSAQAFLDELDFDRIFAEPDWWNNKNGWQLGALFMLPQLPTLDVGFSYSRARPYAYDNRSPSLAYVSGFGYLAHPLGANLSEVTLYGTWRPTPRWTADATLIYSAQGQNPLAPNAADFANYGADPFLPYDFRRPGDYVPLLDGERVDRLTVDASIAYELLPSVRLRTRLLADAQTPETLSATRTLAVILSLEAGLRTPRLFH